MDVPDSERSQLVSVRDWVDISRPLRPGIAVWPGDRPFELERHRNGDLTISSFATTCHLGSHVDAPLHLDPSGVGVEGIPLQRCIGTAEVVRVPASTTVVHTVDLPSGWTPGATFMHWEPCCSRC